MFHSRHIPVGFVVDIEASFSQSTKILPLCTIILMFHNHIHSSQTLHNLRNFKASLNKTKMLVSVFQHLINYYKLNGETIQQIRNNNNGTAVNMNYFKDSRRQNIRKTVFAAVAGSGYSTMFFRLDISK